MKKIFKLENLIALTVILLPSYLWRFKFLGIPTNFLEICFMVFFLGFFLRNDFGKKMKEIIEEKRNYFFWIFLLFLGLIMASIGNEQKFSNLGIIKSWFFLPMTFIFLSFGFLGAIKKEKIWEWLYLSSLGVAVVSWSYFFLGKTTYDGRLEAFFNSPNYLAMYLSPGIIIGVHSFFELSFNNSKEKSKKIFFLISLLVILGSFYQTFSYASWVAVSVSLGWLILLNRKKYFSMIFWVWSAFVLGLIMQIGSKKWETLVNFDSRSSFFSRIMIWKATTKILEDNWAFGIGPANFQEKYLAYQKYFHPYLEWAVPHPHNLFLFFWLAGGILGLVGFWGIMFSWGREVWVKREKTKKIAIPLGIVLYIIFLGFLDTYMKNDLAVVFFMAIFSL